MQNIQINGKDENMNSKRKLLTVLQGMIVGGTMLVPGASGGSMAMILGIYDRLISSISSFFKDVKGNLLFLALFCLGGGVGILVFARPLLYLIERFHMPMMYFFLGAVAGGVPLIFSQAQIKKITWKTVICIIIGIIAVFLIGLIPEGTFQSEMDAGLTSSLLLILAGIFAAVALVLPGISVSYLFLVMGMYDEIMRAISTFYLPFLLPLGIGLLLGVILTTKILETAMHRYPQPTYLIILGFIFGSMVQVFPGIPYGVNFAVCMATFAAGFCAIRYLSMKESQAS